MDNLQAAFFRQIKQSLPGHLSMVDEVASLLNISIDSAYRRIRNEKGLDFEEIKILASHFNISVDRVLHLQTGTGSFKGGFIEPGSLDFGAFLGETLKVLEHVGSFKEKEMIYFCKDFPLFYYFAFPELAAFKYFIWMKTSLNFPELSDVPFSFDYYMKPFIDVGQKVYRAYCSIPGIEIMNVENIATSLLQIEYYRKSFMFANDTVITTLLDKLDDMTDHLQKQAEAGVKFIPSVGPNSQSPKYRLYINDFVIGDNSVIADCGDTTFSFITHSHINFMTITDKKFTEYHLGFTRNLLKKCNLISETAENHRKRFFHMVHRRIDQCRNHRLDIAG